MSFAIVRGFDAGQRAAAAELYWEAFGGKLGRVMGPDARALDYVRAVMRADHALSAVSPRGELLGIAGFKTAAGAFVGGGPADLRRAYGLIGGSLRYAVLSLLPRDVDNQRFLVDGLCVRADMRGYGIGSALIAALCTEARGRGYRELRLDVVAENLRARALYEREGFHPVAVSRNRLTGWVYGFESATTMVRPL